MQVAGSFGDTLVLVSLSVALVAAILILRLPRHRIKTVSVERDDIASKLRRWRGLVKIGYFTTKTTHDRRLPHHATQTQAQEKRLRRRVGIRSTLLLALLTLTSDLNYRLIL